MKRLVLMLALTGCSQGSVGNPCYDNNTCNADLFCVQWWDRAHEKQTVCADPNNLVVGGFVVPKVCPEPETPPACEPGWKRPSK